MELHVVTKFSIFRHKANVTDANEKKLYTLRGRYLSPTRVTYIKNTDGKKLYKVRSKFFHIPFTRTAMIYNDANELVARIRQKASMLNNFTVLDNANELSLEGNFIGWKFNILKGGIVVGTVQAQMSMFGHYIINVFNDEDVEFVLAVFSAILTIKRKNSNNK